MINDFTLIQETDDLQDLIKEIIKNLKECDNKDYYKSQLILLMNEWTKAITKI